MMYKLISALDRRFGIEPAAAHCDIPCAIYDPCAAQVAALTVLRMVDLIEGNADSDETARLNSMARYIASKEEHGVRVKEEIRVIWGDYFKQPQLEKFPEIHELTHEIMLLASKSKQHVNRDLALQLIDRVNRFAEIFWASKNVATKRAVCPYPPEVEMVYPDL
ncbi:MAG: superoxide dismutase, Ni [Gammaproteobacteria bacterium]|nr:superoxide dismutase, Ni [Gammaproteobacteria bacterium]